MIKILKNLMLSVLFICSVTSLFASHIAGGYISYVYTGVSNEYLVTLTVYRDCGGMSLQNTQSILINNDCGETNPSLTLNLEEINEISQICASQLQNTECNGGGLSGIEEHVYRAIVVLPAPCDAWTFSVEIANRNSSTNLTGTFAEVLYVETKMYSATDDSNNTPTFNYQPIPYACTNQVTNQDFAVLELDRDSLVFEFTYTRGAGGDTIPNEVGFTFDEPISGIVMDPATGLLSFTQGFPGTFIVTVLVTEYDICGNLVGTMMHDIQVEVEICNNQAPAIIGVSSVIQNFNNYGTNASIVDSLEINLCNGDKFCFDVQFDDPNAGDNVILSSNVASFLSGATFTQTSGNPATATICWEFTQGYTGSSISINATDGVCPVPGNTDVTIKLDVPPAIFAGSDSVKHICGNPSNTDLFNYLGGRFQNNGQWFDPNGNTISNIVTNSLIDGVYSYVVYPDSTGIVCGIFPNPCVLADTAFLTIITSSPQFSALWSSGNIINETCDGSNDGQAQIGPITGNSGPFTVVWESPYSGVHDTQIVTSNNSAFQTNLYQDQLGGDPWTVTVTDTNNCSITHEFYIYHGCLGINKYNDENNVYNLLFEAYPNPVDQLLYIKIFDSSEKLMITDVTGKVITQLLRLEKGDHSINLSNFESGIYIVNVFTEKSVASQKIIKL